MLFIKDGEVFHQIYRGGQSQDEMYQKISDTLTVLATGNAEKGRYSKWLTEAEAFTGSWR